MLLYKFRIASAPGPVEGVEMKDFNKVNRKLGASSSWFHDQLLMSSTPLTKQDCQRLRLSSGGVW